MRANLFYALKFLNFFLNVYYIKSEQHKYTHKKCIYFQLHSKLKENSEKLLLNILRISSFYKNKCMINKFF